MTFTGLKAEVIKAELIKLNGKLTQALIDQDDQGIDYLRFEISEVGQGRCPDTGYTFERCSESVCDCGWERLPWLDNDDRVG